ncbi:MAG: Gfo/Idh/MocA family oxidoreductase, partial [Planctomycetota bacterium]|nr:Gfo/Idh/MocA family oxidoreductase [Planctomycetota bacterium]
LREHPGVRLVAVSNRGRASAAEAAHAFGIGDVVDDWRELVGRDDVDAVLVTAAAALHEEATRRAIEHGKHVLCEAPLAASSAAARALLEAAEAAPIVHGYVHPRPLLDGGERVAELLANGAIGEVASARLALGHPGSGGDLPRPVLAGIAAGVCVHLFGEVARVDGNVLATEAGPEIELALGDGGRDGLRVEGSTGALVWDWKPSRITVERDGAADEIAFEPSPWRPTRDFVDAVLAGRRPALDFRRGAHELELVERLLGG